MNKNPRLALFDLDLTILSINSAWDWISNERRLGYVNSFQSLQAAFHLLRYKYAGADMSAAISKGVSHLKGELEADFRRRTQAFWEEKLKDKVRPGARQCILHHQQAGDHIALLTSSSIYLAEVVAKHLSIPHVVAMQFEVMEGRFTGKPIYPLCHGQGKTILAHELAADLNMSLRDAYFYTDSYSDLPTLEAVGEPVLIHPDRRLHRLGLKRNWRVELWD